MHITYRSVLHHDLEFAVALLRLPARHKMQQMVALGLPAFFLALFTAQLDAARDEERAVCRWVVHLLIWHVSTSRHCVDKIHYEIP